MDWGSPCFMMILAGFLWNFEDVINFASRIYCLKIISNDCTNFEAKKLNRHSLSSVLINFLSQKWYFLVEWKKKFDNKEKIEDIFCDVTCKYSVTFFFNIKIREMLLSPLHLTHEK